MSLKGGEWDSSASSEVSAAGVTRPARGKRVREECAHGLDKSRRVKRVPLYWLSLLVLTKVTSGRDDGGGARGHREDCQIYSENREKSVHESMGEQRPVQVTGKPM